MFKYLPSSVSTQFQLHLSRNSTQSQLNPTSTQTTELGTTQLKLVIIIVVVVIIIVVVVNVVVVALLVETDQIILSYGQ